MQIYGTRTGPLWSSPVALVLLCASTLTIMASAAISPALPLLENLHADEPNAEFFTRLLLSAPSLTVVLTAAVAGMIADRLPRKPLLVFGICLFVLAGSAGAFLPDLTSILLSRLGLGVAVAIVMTTQMAMVGDVFHGERRADFMGLQSTAINLSGVLFIVTAAMLSRENVSFVFLVYCLPMFLIPFALVCLPSGHRDERSTADAQTPSLSSEDGWIWRGLTAGCLSCLITLVFFTMPTQLPFLVLELGLDPLVGTVLALGALMLSGAAMGLSYRRLLGHLGLTGVFVLGLLMMAVGFALLATSLDLTGLIGGAAIVGGGYGIVTPSMFSLSLKLAPVHRRGTVSGFVTTGIFLGQVLSPVCFTPLVATFGFSFALSVAAAILAIMTVTGVSIHLMGIRKAPA